ncbi:hypothetical protein D9613_012338 [Agrocybe pediades]|uniref:FHA domain-containing protein n=1 Tax=Agrocybe pediades TaxID=84607 RepID=A0A8H4QEY5_9AGAR|nr:hypothetical protein D9613_012338 [Agrocybe pediades]
MPGMAATASTSANAGFIFANTHRIRLVAHLDSPQEFRFDAMEINLKEGGPALRIGRGGFSLFKFKWDQPEARLPGRVLNSNKLGFRSKVVSRAHAEIWVEAGGKLFIRDMKSSGGTYLNGIRLSPAKTESPIFEVKDGDILQLGVDYCGGVVNFYQAVKMRIVIGRNADAIRVK